jgi:hypothetical protein
LPVCPSNFQTKILSSPKSVCSTKRPDRSAWIMCACVRSCPLKAKLPGGAPAVLVGPSLPASFWTSVASPSTSACRVDRQATRARSHLVNGDGRHRTGFAIHPKQMNAAAIAWRQIDLSRQHVVERRAEGADICK